jgi:asparagine synthase (glutamine-hydrolysing)
MCGIAGVVNLAGDQQVPRGTVGAMAHALLHRGPDQDGFFEQPGLSLASRRLSIVGLADGRQPISNEDQTVFVVYNGEFFDYPEKRRALESRGHRFATHCDTELIPHLWEDYQEGMFEHLRGQFALALWDQRQRRLILARDRFGICPLYWSRQTSPAGDWFLFASEVKGLLASGLVPAKPDPGGINHAFSFFPAALPGPVTCFQGVQALVPGHYLDIRLGTAASSPPILERTYWEIDFPDQGDEEVGDDPKRLVDDFEALLLAAVEKRLRADVPVVSYLSGGVDSSLLVAMACHIRKEPIPTFTVRIEDPRLDETRHAALVARHVGADSILVNCGAKEVVNTYPKVIQAVEGPVIDTSSAAVLLLAREVHQRGYKAALTGEGADEWLLGYPGSRSTSC